MAVLKRWTVILVMGWGLVLATGAEENRRVQFGLTGGWAWGTSWEFGWKFRGHSNQYDGLRYHLGAFAQLPLVRPFGAQLAVDYQAARNEMTWYFSVPGPVYSSAEPFHFLSVSLNVVVELPIGRRCGIYALGGGGPSWGDWVNHFEGIYFHVDGGLGVRLALSPKPQSPFLILGGVFRHLFDTGDWSSLKASYLRFLIGIGI
ncbi:MAG: hypothetical protein NTZ26_15605 [Candidatus Aminicenantes bacterium]|nr:hypothetical protein [Candidatus Aminicenantes bacterium]